jgi:tetratricopeptide (TPR) repeat protein
MGLSYYFQGEYEEAAKYYELALEYGDTTKYWYWGNLAAAQYWVDGKRNDAIGTYRKAIRHAERELRAQPESSSIIQDLIGYYAMSGDQKNGRRMIAYGDSVVVDDPYTLFVIGDAYELFGERQLALKYIGQAIRGGVAVEEVLSTPTLADLVEDTRFKQMISKKQTGENSPPSDASAD